MSRIVLFLLLSLSVSACGFLKESSCDQEENTGQESTYDCARDSLDGGDPVGPPSRSKALDLLSDFQRQVARTAGANAIALRGLQSADLGDVYILKSDDKTLQSYTGNIARKVDSTLLEEKDGQPSLNNITFSLTWSRTLQNEERLGLDHLDFLFEAIFKNETVEEVEVQVSIHDATLTQLLSPGDALQSYEANFNDNEVLGNIIITGVLSGRYRTQVRAFDKNRQEVSLNASLLSSDVNKLPGVSAGYTEAVETGADATIVQESQSTSTVFAATYLSVSPSKQNNNFITAQINASANQGEAITVYRVNENFIDETNQTVLVFKFRQERKMVAGKERVDWHLDIRNVHYAGNSISFSYSMNIYDLNGNLLFYHQDAVSALEVDREKNIGIISNDPTLLRLVNTSNIDINNWIVH